MKQLVIILAVLTASVPAMAQIVPQISNPVPPVPQPPPLPPPSMAVPTVPKMDAPPQPAAPKADRRSFNHRFNDCQTDAITARLDSSERASYARVCANQL